ncbi:lipopolysaccharide biosynthesis protein [Conexibacter sp. CPCC 206217]|uniref:lipopolysaccharide biosynthesis protein n=1 Tax=Conexibacter sp. CPCC 206217 TaxID=3064574 RepID=UPI0027230D90|nr:oligosaccharide flippase family protein [Conexibacter sp. CPCC 206217]MDO8212766.1 oligosaccharide flippase family protein [Conexibacter sp. CPCC 206217]
MSRDGGGRNRGRLVLTAGIASTGILSFLYLALASRELSAVDYGHVSLLWSIAFVILSVIYRPIEQLLSRTIADRRARGLHDHSLRTPALIQAAFALLFLIAALALRTTIEDELFDGSSSLYWILVIAVLAYAGSYFARGWLAGHERFAGYGGLVLLESTSRFLFAVAAVLGITSGQTAIAIGIAVAPFVSLVVVPFAIRRMQRGEGPVGGSVLATADVAVLDAAGEGPAHAEIEEASSDLSLRHGSGFAIAVFAIMLAEQTLMNASVLIVEHTSGPALAGFVFNVLLIVRAPLQLFQAVQTSILPHLTGLEARENSDAFAHAIRVTVLAIAAFAGACALGLLAIGPWVMETLLGDKGFAYERGGLALVALGMGFHLVAGTLNQAALARGRAAQAAVAWLLVAVLFVAWVASPIVSDEVMRVESGYFGAAFILSGLLFALYRRPAD